MGGQAGRHRRRPAATPPPQGGVPSAAAVTARAHRRCGHQVQPPRRDQPQRLGARCPRQPGPRSPVHRRCRHCHHRRRSRVPGAGEHGGAQRYRGVRPRSQLTHTSRRGSRPAPHQRVRTHAGRHRASGPRGRAAREDRRREAAVGSGTRQTRAQPARPLATAADRSLQPARRCAVRRDRGRRCSTGLLSPLPRAGSTRR